MSGRARRAWARARDPRILVGLAITAGSLWYAFQDVSFSALGEAIANANLPLLILPSVVLYFLMTWVRSLRWRHLTDAVMPLTTGPLFRAIAVGFMANNIFPLRLGEFIRAWYLARETGASSAAVFGTVIVERLLDAVVVIGLGAVVLGAGGAQAAGLEVRTVLPALMAAALIPALFIACLRIAPEASIGLGLRISGTVLPEQLNQRLEVVVRKLAEGLGALRGGSHLWWLVFHSLVLWLVLAVLPFAVAILAMGIDLGSFARLAAASYSLLFWVGAAVAIPSAPGFFGPYHAACWLALRPFDVPKETAIALGTLCHAVFWVTATALGLLVLRMRRTSLDEIDEAASASGKDPLPDRR